MTGPDLRATSAIVVAAGRGERFGRPKADLTLAGNELWRIAYDLFDTVGIERIILVGDVPGGVPGGVRRRDSVGAGLDRIGDARYVLVHDVARPLATPDLVERVLARLTREDVDGVVPVIPVADTVKRVDGETVTATVDRSDLVSVQTPQGFRATSLLRAHETHPDLDATDDAGLVELGGGSVVTVAGHHDNFKITWPGDLLRAEATLSAFGRTAGERDGSPDV